MAQRSHPPVFSFTTPIKPHRSPTRHERFPGAAVCVDAPPLQDHIERPTRTAQAPLRLTGGRKALAIRQHPERGLEVLIQTGPDRRWRLASDMLTVEQAQQWVAAGF